MRRWRTLVPPPKPVRRRTVQLETMALVPARARSQALANQLPPGAALVMLPAEAGKSCQLRATAGLSRQCAAGARWRSRKARMSGA